MANKHQKQIYAVLEAEYREGEKFYDEQVIGFEPTTKLYKTHDEAVKAGEERIAWYKKNRGYKRQDGSWWDSENITLWKEDGSQWCYIVILYLKNPFEAEVNNG